MYPARHTLEDRGVRRPGTSTGRLEHETWSHPLSQYQTILQGGKNGPALTPGNVAASLIYRRQTASQPHFGQMLADEIKAAAAWIEAGAPER